MASLVPRFLRPVLFAACVTAPPLDAASPDYEVTLRRGARTWPVSTHRSVNRPYDKTLDSEGRYIRLSFLALHSVEPRPPEKNRDTYAHSWALFEFHGGPVEVEVKIRRTFPGLTLSLERCAVLPSELGISAQVAGGDTIRFTLPRPAKVAVVPSQRAALQRLAATETKQAVEGYGNPLFLFAPAPETDVPDPHAPGTLVVRPGRPTLASSWTPPTKSP